MGDPGEPPAAHPAPSAEEAAQVHYCSVYGRTKGLQQRMHFVQTVLHSICCVTNLQGPVEGTALSNPGEPLRKRPKTRLPEEEPHQVKHCSLQYSHRQHMPQSGSLQTHFCFCKDMQERRHRLSCESHLPNAQTRVWRWLRRSVSAASMPAAMPLSNSRQSVRVGVHSLSGVVLWQGPAAEETAFSLSGQPCARQGSEDRAQ